MSSCYKSLPKPVSDYRYPPTTEERVAELRSQLVDTTEEGERLSVLDELSFHIARRDPLQASRYAREELGLASSLKDTGWIARSYRRLGSVAHEEARYFHALRYVKKACRLLKTLPGENREALSEKALVNDMMGIFLAEKNGDTEAALRMYMSSLQMRKELSDEIGIAESLYRIGESYSNLGLIAQALNVLDEALEIYERHSHAKRISDAQSRISLLYLMLGDTDTALGFLQKAIDSMSDLPGRIDKYRILAMAYRDRGAYDLALEYHHQYGEFYANDPFRSALTFMDKGRVYRHSRKFDLALHHAGKAEETFEALGHKGALGDIFSEKGWTYIAQQQWEQAIIALKKGLEIASGIGMIFQKKVLLLGLAQAYEGNGQTEESLHHYRLFMELEKEVLSHEVQRKVMGYYLQSQLRQIISRKEEYRAQKKQLEKEAEHRARELTVISLHVAQDNEMLDNLRKRLVELGNANGHSGAVINSILREIDDRAGRVDAWNTFERRLQTLDQKFIHNLTTRYPDLTPAELRICSLLAINMSNREIATLLNLSDRTIDTHRTNIRRKMRLGREENLVTVLDGM